MFLDDNGDADGRRPRNAVVLLDAAPGYESSAAACLRRLSHVVAVARVRRGSHDLAVLLDTADDVEVGRLMANDLRLVSGVSDVEHVPRPDAPLLRALIMAARWSDVKGATAV